MTFLAARFGGAGGPAADASCDAMLAAQHAPAARETWFGDGAALAAAVVPRLSGGDMSALGETACGRWVLAFDARLDDRASLAAALGLGARAAESGARLLIAAWQKWGIDAPDRLCGDFAIIAWDRRERVMVLARDPLGQRPLHFSGVRGGYAVASMPAGLLALLGAQAAPDLDRLAMVLGHQPCQGGRSFLAGIERVCPGECIRLGADGGPNRTVFWAPRLDVDAALTTRDCAEELGSLLRAATADRLRDAGPVVASHLSAGLDSSAVTAFAAITRPADCNLIAVTAIPDPALGQAVPPGRIADESVHAAATATRLGIAHDRVGARTGFATLLDDAFAFLPQPLPNAHNYGWSAAIFDHLQARGIDMLLTGQAGNLSFSMGASPGPRALLRAGRWRLAMREMLGNGRITSLVQRAGRRRPSQRPEDWTLLTPERLAAGPVEPVPATPSAATIVGMDAGTLLRGFFTRWGVDMRDPTADRRLIECALRIPDSAKLDAYRDRAPARQALHGLIPDSVRLERRRGYQAADWLGRMTAECPAIRHEVAALARSDVAQGLVDVPRMQQLVDAWPTTGRYDPDVERVYRYVLPQGLAVAAWARRVAGE